MTGHREHTPTQLCWCNPTRERWDEQTQQWVTVNE
jgi:hypothetical protein